MNLFLSISKPAQSRLLLLTQVLLLGTASSLFGGNTRTWDGQGATPDWSDKANWNGHTPGDTDTAVLSSTIGIGATPTLNTPNTIGDLSYNSSAAAFTISGTSALTINANGNLGGGIGIQLASGSANSQVINAPIILGASQTWNIQANTLTAGGIISGSGFSLTKSGAGTLALSGNNTYTGGTTLSQGILQLAANNVIPDSGTFAFAGGTLAANNKTDTIGALSLTANSTLNLVNDATHSDLHFASGTGSSGVTLTINGWTGTAGGGTGDRIFLDSGTGATQLLQDITFTGFTPGAIRLASGEIVPVPEPINVALGAFGVILAGIGLARRFREHAGKRARLQHK